MSQSMRRWFMGLALLALMAGLVAPAGAAGLPDRILRPDGQETVRLMVQLQSAPLADAPGPVQEKQITAEQKDLRTQLQAAGIAYREFHANQKLFNGLTISVKAKDIGRVSGLRGVTGVFRSTKTSAPEPQLYSSTKMIGADKAWAGAPGKGIPGVDGTGITVAVIDTGISVG